MPPETAAALIERVKRHWRTAPEFEITLEANPNSAEAERFAGFATAGRARDALHLLHLGRVGDDHIVGRLTGISITRSIVPSGATRTIQPPP